MKVKERERGKKMSRWPSGEVQVNVEHGRVCVFAGCEVCSGSCIGVLWTE